VTEAGPCRCARVVPKDPARFSRVIRFGCLATFGAALEVRPIFAFRDCSCCVLAERLLTLAFFDRSGFAVRILPPGFVDRSVELSARFSTLRCPRRVCLSLAALPEALPTARFPAVAVEPSGPTLEV
jgi:hypothetical protein